MKFITNILFHPEKIRPPHFSLAFLILAAILHFFLKPAPLIAYPYKWIGLLIFSVGILLMKKAHGGFKQNGTPVSHAETPQKVVTDGAHKFSRNPMYVAGALIFFGIAVIIGTWPFFLSWLCIGATLHFLVIPWEEKRMHNLFGKEYLEYKIKTRRWL